MQFLPTGDLKGLVASMSADSSADRRRALRAAAASKRAQYLEKRGQAPTVEGGEEKPVSGPTKLPGAAQSYDAFCASFDYSLYTRAAPEEVESVLELRAARAAAGTTRRPPGGSDMSPSAPRAATASAPRAVTAATPLDDDDPVLKPMSAELAARHSGPLWEAVPRGPGVPAPTAGAGAPAARPPPEALYSGVRRSFSPILTDADLEAFPSFAEFLKRGGVNSGPTFEILSDDEDDKDGEPVEEGGDPPALPGAVVEVDGDDFEGASAALVPDGDMVGRIGVTDSSAMPASGVTMNNFVEEVLSGDDSSDEDGAAAGAGEPVMEAIAEDVGGDPVLPFSL